MAKTIEEKFWSRINKTDTCWLWTGGKNRQGYGNFKNNGITHSAHRFSWRLHFGDIPEGIQVCHRCDTTSCVCPDHLFLGTQIDNMRDMYEKGRNHDYHGENNPFFGKHHTKEVVEKIRNMNIGKKASDEVRKKMSETRRGKNMGELHPMWGRHHSEESKEKMRIARQRRIIK